MLRKLLLVLTITSLVSLGFGVATAHAYNPLGDACAQQADAPTCSDQNGDKLTGDNGVFLRVVRILALLAGSAAIILIIVSGIQYVTSNGDANKVSQAKNTIIYALVGLVIIFASQAIVTYVIKEITT